MTGYPNDNVRARAMKAGAVCFLNKPFSEDHFIGYRESFEGCLKVVDQALLSGQMHTAFGWRRRGCEWARVPSS